VKIEAKTGEELEQVNTVEGILSRLREFSKNDALTHRVFQFSRYQKLSEYETMVFLAYNALVGREKAVDAYMDHMSVCCGSSLPHDLLRATQSTSQS
jgi:hypothetical protein